MIEVTAADSAPPADFNATMVVRARCPLLLPIKGNGDLVPVCAGTLLALNDAAFDESEWLGGAVLALVSIGAFELVRDGALN
jgi:hypothetical protein